MGKAKERDFIETNDLFKEEETLVDNVVPFESNKVKKSERTVFYKVSNHLELFKIGSSFYKDYEQGIKSFAISSTGYHSSQQQTILGIASFFDHSDQDLKILIMSEKLMTGAFSEVVSACEREKLQFKKAKLECEVLSFYDHFDFVDIEVLDYLSQTSGSEDYDSIIDCLYSHYDIIFWDVPELNFLKTKPKIYFPIISRFSCLSIVVSKNISKTSEVEEICNFFMSYGLSLKGLLFEAVPVMDEKNSKLSWWRRFYREKFKYPFGSKNNS